jgi:hypothetical protein
MNDNVKRTFKAPTVLILAGFIIVIAGMKAASSILVPLRNSARTPSAI